MQPIEPPYYPIIYVRGYAGRARDIADTVATPYMGFNDGSMKERRNYRGRPERHVFESPLLRLVKDHHYHDIHKQSDAWTLGDSPRVIAIHRYYERADSELGDGQAQTVTTAAESLSRLILELYDAIHAATMRDGKDENAPFIFGVHLVAHSMGGLVCRALLQNRKIGSDDARRLVRRVFTYATPHDGISFRGLHLGRLRSLLSDEQFNHVTMAKYLALEPGSKHVNTLEGRFPSAQMFCLVGTNHHDYDVAYGGSRKAAGPGSDGLVMMESAVLQGDGPRAYVHRSHSGHYGIVNSEEGYRNLVTFLFAGWRIDGGLRVTTLPPPPTIDGDRTGGVVVQTAHNIEVGVVPLGSTGYRLTQRKIDHDSATVRPEAELVAVPGVAERPSGEELRLFSLFAESDDESVEFNVELAISPTEFAFDGRVDPRRFIPGEYLFQDTIRIRLEHANDEWTLSYGLTSVGWGEQVKDRAERVADNVFEVTLSSVKFTGTLHIVVTRMIDRPAGEPDDARDADKDPSGGGTELQPVPEPVRTRAVSREEERVLVRVIDDPVVA